MEFDDIGVPAGSRYRFRVRNAREREFGVWKETPAHVVPIPPKTKKMIVMQVQTLLDSKKKIWSPSVDVFLENKNGLKILGIKRKTSASVMKAGQRSWEPEPESSGGGESH